MPPSAIQLVPLPRRRRWQSPILAKEMRVTSRRVWLYGLRFAYLAMLGIFTVLVWASWTKGLSGGVEASRLADVGKHIVASIVWFQFIAAQAITVVLLSASISGEVRKRTLPVLLTTPLGSFRIALEKIAGGVLYVAILLVCCLPLLSVVRVFGGVPWGFVLTSLAVTLGACFFAGAVATYFSVRTSSPFAAAILSILAVAIFHLLGWSEGPIFLIVAYLCICWGMFSDPARPRRRVASGCLAAVMALVAVVGLVVGTILLFAAAASLKVVLPLSPAYALHRSSENMMVPGSLAGPNVTMAINIALVGLASFGVLRRCANRLNEVARYRIWGLEPQAAYGLVDPLVAARALQILGSPALPPAAGAVVERLTAGALPPAAPAEGHVRAARSSAQTAGRHVAPPASWPSRSQHSAGAEGGSWVPPASCQRLGSALFWKDTRRLFLRNDALRFFCQHLPLSVMVIVYAFSLVTAGYRSVAWHTTILTIYVSAGTLLTAVLSATTISVERQSRTWPILLTTAMSSRHILWAKSAAVFYRCLPAWAPMLAHLLIFTLCLQLHPLLTGCMVLLVAWIHLFFCGAGFYFSMVFRGTSMPLIANLALGTVLWFILPVLAPMAVEIVGPDAIPGSVGRNLTQMQALTPVGQSIAMTRAFPGLLSADGPQSRPWPVPAEAESERAEALRVAGLAAAAHGLLGGAFLWRARRKFRKNAFA